MLFVVFLLQVRNFQLDYCLDAAAPKVKVTVQANPALVHHRSYRHDSPGVAEVLAALASTAKQMRDKINQIRNFQTLLSIALLETFGLKLL